MADVEYSEEEVAEAVAVVEGVKAEVQSDFKGDPEALPAEMKGERYPKRPGSITIFMDGVAGEQHAAVTSGLELLEGAILSAAERGDEETRADLQEKYDAAEEKAAEIRKGLLQSAFSFELRALPPVIMRGLRREIRADLGIKTKGVPEEREEEYNDLFAIKLTAKQTVRFVDHSISDQPANVTEAELVAKLTEIYNEGDEFQWLRLNNLVNDLQFRNTISSSVVESADFS